MSALKTGWRHCQGMNGWDAESCPHLCPLLVITLYWQLSEKLNKRRRRFSGCSAGCSLHISSRDWLIVSKEGVGRTFDWNCSPSSDSGEWQLCDLHFSRPDSPSTRQGYWLSLPGKPRRPSAWLCNGKKKTKKNQNIKLHDIGTVRRKAHKLSFSNTHGLYCFFAVPDTHRETCQREIQWAGALIASHRGHKTNASHFPPTTQTCKKATTLKNNIWIWTIVRLIKNML